MDKDTDLFGKYTHFGIATAFTAVVMLLSFTACGGDKAHMAPAINPKDSVPFMRARGISNLISDSGVIRYKIVAEDWDIYSNPEDNTRKSKWTFLKGLFMEKFDLQFHIEWFLQADTAYCYDENLWELRGRVQVRNVEGTVFRTEELFWNMGQHIVYSHKFMRVVTPERELQGYNFRSNEQMTDYIIYNSKGSFPVEEQQSAPPDSMNMRQQPSKPR